MLPVFPVLGGVVGVVGGGVIGVVGVVGGGVVTFSSIVTVTPENDGFAFVSSGV